MFSAILKKYWGFDSLRPLQLEIVETILAGRDSVAVLPTGGGKSLCYQLPALCKPGLAIVVSPLIALMKDQVDTLQSQGIAAAAINSLQGAQERRAAADEIVAGKLKLLYMAPERLLADKTLEFLSKQNLAYIAVDEAHCISSWGHDFRPDYRELRRLRAVFPQVAVHAFTATATPRVRQDIATELDLREPSEFVGNFRRSNLIYRAVPRKGGLNQICSVLDAHRGQSGIVYCISRAAVEETSQLLNELGYKTLPYHAGLADEKRSVHQDAFLTEQVDTMVATIAFGMGIDKSNVRYVIHLGMPRSLENYQQESGRAGRDGLPAECWLLYSPKDLRTWQLIVAQQDNPATQSALASLQHIYQFCTSVRCRHQILVEHFGQSINSPCGACDVCLGELQEVTDALTVAQKILSCVLRVSERFGTAHVAAVLHGSKSKQVLKFAHQKLSTWGLLKESRREQIRDWIEQLVGQGMLIKIGDYQQLQVTALGWEVVRSERTLRLLQHPHDRQPPLDVKHTPASILDSWEGVDRTLFEKLRSLRMQCAVRANLPAYIIFSDTTLRDMARRRPSGLEQLLDVHGVGNKKAEDFGNEFLSCIDAHCNENQQTMDIRSEPTSVTGLPWDSAKLAKSSHDTQAFELFEQGLSVENIAEQMSLACSTVQEYLVKFILKKRITDPSAWVSKRDGQRVEVAAQYAALEKSPPLRLRVIYDALHGQLDYPSIKFVLACRTNRLRLETPNAT